MANSIQIKRSNSAATPASLLEGELGFSFVSDKLFIGDLGGSAVIEIGGPGLLANYALLNSPVFTGDPTAPTPPTADNDTSIATTAFVKAQSLSDFQVPTGDISWNNFKITNLADPTNPQDAATKAYADSIAQGLDVKQSVRVATQAAIDLTAPGATVDGVTMALDNRVLVKEGSTVNTGSTSIDNGIYLWKGAAVAMVRAIDFDDDAEVTAGAFTFVEEGTDDNIGYVLTTNDPITVGTTGLTFAPFTGAGSIIAGDGLTQVGNTFNVVTADSGRIVVNANDIDLATTAVTPGTYIGFTVDAYGRVTGVTTPTTLAGYGITDAQAGDPDLDALAAISGTGIAVRTGTSTWDVRTITGTTNEIDVANGDGVSGNPTLSISAGYVGQTSITDLGTITTGTWNADVIGAAYGGTGLSSFTANAVFYANAAGTAMEQDANFTFNGTTDTLTLNGTLDGAIVDGGSF